MKHAFAKLILATGVAFCTMTPMTTVGQTHLEPPPMPDESGAIPLEGESASIGHPDSYNPAEAPPDGTPIPMPAGRFYAGGGAGRVHYAEMNPTASSLDSQMGNVGISSSTSYDENDVGYKAFVGYRAERHWGFFDRQAVEVAYVDLGQVTGNVKITSPVAVKTQHTSEIRGLALTWNGGRTLGPKMMAFMKAGAYLWEQKSSFAVSGTSGSVNLTGTDEGFSPMVGLGGEYYVTPDMGIRGEWEYFSEIGDPNGLGSTDAHLMTMSGMVTF